MILKVAFGLPEADLSQLNVGENIFVWKVVDRNDKEILLSWQQGTVSGHTWFFVPSDENVIIFGTSIATPRLLGSGNEPHRTNTDRCGLPVTGDKLLSVFTTLRKPNTSGETKSCVESVMIAAGILSWQILVTFHSYYSKMLVYAAIRTLSKEES